MKSSYFINLGLILLVATLYWFNNQSDKTPAITLTKISPGDIKHITIAQATRDDIILKKQGNAWQLEKPLHANANPIRIQLLLSLLNTAPSRQRDIQPGQDLNQFGLNNNSPKLTLNEHQFTFGDIEPISQQRYLAYNDHLYLLDDTIAPLLNASASSFIDNRLIPKNSSITRLTVPLYQQRSLSNNSITLTLTDSHWQTSTEHSTNSDQLTTLVSAWQQAQALQVLPLAAIEHKQLGPQQQATITLSPGNETLSVFLALNEQSFFIINPQTQLAYQFPKTFFQHLLLPLK